MSNGKSAAEILGNPEYQAISYGGYRQNTRDVQPTLPQIKEDMKILYAMGIRVLRTYNVQLPQAGNILEAIRQLKKEDPSFEMYVMLGAWIDCHNAWTGHEPDHYRESEANAGEIERAVALVNKYPDIVKIIAVGNEAMVHWATSYFVQPEVILKWVNHLQGLKKKNKLPADVWITSSDNFASWGGGDTVYHKPALTELMQAVDYLSIHTYPMHDTHYHPVFWGVKEEEHGMADSVILDKVMQRALNYAAGQYQSVVDYMRSLGINKPVHIGETGWASFSNEMYGIEGTKACDEYKQGLYYKKIREWSNFHKVSCFYFEAFDENWKDAGNAGGSENHFGLFDIEGRAKFPLWSLVDAGVFEGLTRDGNTIIKTYDGDKKALLHEVQLPMHGHLVH